MAIESIKEVSSAYQGSKLNLQEPVTGRVVVTAGKQDKADYSVVENNKCALNDTEQEKSTEQNRQIRKAVEDINKSVTGAQTEAIFGIHEDTNRVTIKIVDKKSKEVIKEYPPEKTLDMIAKVWEMAGIMVDEKR